MNGPLLMRRGKYATLNLTTSLTLFPPSLTSILCSYCLILNFLPTSVFLLLSSFLCTTERAPWKQRCDCRPTSHPAGTIAR